jgi:hypothetical protein
VLMAIFEGRHLGCPRAARKIGATVRVNLGVPLPVIITRI